MKKIWVLTASYNDYDQHGDYFVAAFDKKPSRKDIEDLKLTEVMNWEPAKSDAINHILEGGGRRKCEQVWYDLVQYNIGSNYHD